MRCTRQQTMMQTQALGRRVVWSTAAFQTWHDDCRSAERRKVEEAQGSFVLRDLVRGGMVKLMTSSFGLHLQYSAMKHVLDWPQTSNVYLFSALASLFQEAILNLFDNTRHDPCGSRGRSPVLPEMARFQGMWGLTPPIATDCHGLLTHILARVSMKGPYYRNREATRPCLPYFPWNPHQPVRSS